MATKKTDDVYIEYDSKWQIFRFLNNGVEFMIVPIKDAKIIADYIIEYYKKEKEES